MRARHLCLTTSCLAVGLAGCGSAQSGGLSPSSADTIRAKLAAVAQEADRGDRTAALTALSSAGAAIDNQGSRLTASQRAALQTGLTRVRSRILATLPAPGATTTTTTPNPVTTQTTTTTTTTTPAPAPSPGPPPGPHGQGPNGQGPPGHAPGHGHGHGHGDGGGNGKGGGD